MFNASPLLLAAYVGDRESVAMLLKAGGDIERTMLIIGKLPITPTLAATWGDHQGVLEDLLRAGHDGPAFLGDDIAAFPALRLL